jgi:hypothetical protein
MASAELTGTVSLKEMLISGPPQLKMHSLAMITQHKMEGEIDESYLPALRVCANDQSVAIRMVTASILGDHFIKDHVSPSSEAVELLHMLAKDPNEDVRFTALNKGLCEIHPKSETLIATLIDVAATERDAALLEKIKHELVEEQATEALLDARLTQIGSVEYFETYRYILDKDPADIEPYLDMPSSRPRLFFFLAEEQDEALALQELDRQLKQLGIREPILSQYGSAGDPLYLLKTFITHDYMVVEKYFSDAKDYTLSQSFWLTPTLEMEINALQ